MSKNVVFMGVVGWNYFLSSRWCLYSLTKRMLNYSFNSPLFHLSLSLSLSLCLEIGAIWLAGPSRNKRCEAGLGEGVAVFYEPLKFYSSLHRGSLRPRGRHALNKLSSFLHPLRPNICLPTLPSPLTRSPPNPSTHRLNGLFIVWCSSPTSSFFPSLALPLSVFRPPLVFSGVEVWLMWFVRMFVLRVDSSCVSVWVHACASATYVQYVYKFLWRVVLFPLLLCFMGAYQTF